jgi:hypothetical protein
LAAAKATATGSVQPVAGTTPFFKAFKNIFSFVSSIAGIVFLPNQFFIKELALL